jgi:anaerobic magnesium-protoporphyrin IX monomethyl ester cyclase
LADIVLFYPETGLDLKRVSIWLPLSVLSVASVLTPEFEVALVDQRVDPHWKRSLRREITARTLCAGISSMTGTQISNGLKAARAIREMAPELPIVWGGIHPTLLHQQTAAHPLVDLVVVGEGETTFLNLVRALAGQGARRDGSWRDCTGIAWRHNDEVVCRPPAPGEFLDLDRLPELPYGLVEVERYVQGKLFFGRNTRSLPFIGSRGCPHECTFCCQPVLSGRRKREMSAGRVVSQVLELARRFGLDAIDFYDEEFFSNVGRGMEIAEAIGGQFDWYVQTRMDDLLRLDLGRLEHCGLKAVQPGLESGSPRILEMIKKRETVEDFLEGNRRLARTGIRPVYNFMMGFPSETMEELHRSLDLAITILQENPHAEIASFYMYVPYPGSELYSEALRNGFAEPSSLEGWALYKRSHLDTPWTAPHRARYGQVLVTSKCIDGRRWVKVMGDSRPARMVAGWLSRRYRERWRSRKLDPTWDIRLLSAIVPR